jgi:hypothetical protein
MALLLRGGQGQTGAHCLFPQHQPLHSSNGLSFVSLQCQLACAPCTHVAKCEALFVFAAVCAGDVARAHSIAAGMRRRWTPG